MAMRYHCGCLHLALVAPVGSSCACVCTIAWLVQGHALTICHRTLARSLVDGGSAQLGPKLIMLARMGKDVTTFLALFLVFMMMYGVGTEALLGPHNLADVAAHPETALGRITYRPWYGSFDIIMGPPPFSRMSLLCVAHGLHDAL